MDVLAGSTGKALSNKLIRAGRSMNAAVYFVTQNSGDVDDEKMKNNIGLKFAFRSTDIKEIKNTLEFLVWIRRTRATRNDLGIWKTDNACFKICMGVWALSRFTLYSLTCSMPLIPDRQYRQKKRGEAYEKTKNPTILRYRSVCDSRRADDFIHHRNGDLCGWTGG